MKKILVITREQDLHCDFVTQKIRERGGDIIRINTDKITSNLSYTFSNLSQDCFTQSFKISDSELSFQSNSYDTIWYRKPLPVNVHYKHKTISDFINVEYNLFLQEFYALNFRKKWINDIGAMTNAGFKLRNLTLAHNLGLKTPNTLVTNNAEDVESFAKSCNWNIIVKAFRATSVNYNNKEFALYTNKITFDQFQKFKEDVAVCPTLLQEYIQKDIELRVTIAGNNIFTAAIHSQQNDLTMYDFRAGQTFELKHSVYQLPDAVSKALLSFNQYYGLVFSTFDLILTPQGEYVFLECNPNGQWYWIEELTGMPISDAIAELLLRS